MEDQPIYETSPVPANPKQDPLVSKRLVDFYTALKAVVDGKKATRLDWQNAGEYMFLRSEILHIRREIAGNPHVEHVLQVSLGDMIADDWLVLD